MRFRDLAVGACFTFEIEHQYSWGVARGPWRKVSARTYRHTDAKQQFWYGGPIKVGTVAVEVRELPSRCFPDR